MAAQGTPRVTEIDAVRPAVVLDAPDDRVLLGPRPMETRSGMAAADELMLKVAKTNVSVLILGESGTGKEVAARAIHRLSNRHDRPFLKVNCAALPGELLESELFGYEPGAFTGATRLKPGQFELCNGGTLLLDEVGEFPSELQAKLLHVIQDGQFSRLGGRTLVKVDVRILAATNVDIHEAMAAKRFREDLYYRLSAFVVRLPPLRARRGEIPHLLRAFIQQFGAESGCTPLPVTRELLDACMHYSWPGNIRELENVVKRYLILGDTRVIVQELAERSQTSLPATLERASSEGLKRVMRQVKREAESTLIVEALQTTGYNRRQAARLLKISYKALQNKTKEYALIRRSGRDVTSISG